MAEKKESRDEKLIEELYEKLWWYTYEAGEEEFDQEEVDAIVRLLDVLEPVHDDQAYEPGAKASLKRFWERYGEEEEDADSGKTEGTAEADSPEDPIPVRRRKWKKVFVRVAVGAAACTVLLISVNVGSYALRRKSFFEIVQEEVGRTEITVTGNTEEFEENADESIECASWAEVEEIVGTDILEPAYIPQGYELETLVIQSVAPKIVIGATYRDDAEHYIRISIDIYEKNFKNAVVQYDKDWVLLEEETTDYEARYYGKDDMIEAFFMRNTQVYYVLSNDSIDMLRSFIHKMK